jgi:hypothetical protein
MIESCASSSLRLPRRVIFPNFLLFQATSRGENIYLSIIYRERGNASFLSDKPSWLIGRSDDGYVVFYLQGKIDAKKKNETRFLYSSSFRLLSNSQYTQKDLRFLKRILFIRNHLTTTSRIREKNSTGKTLNFNLFKLLVIHRDYV